MKYIIAAFIDERCLEHNLSISCQLHVTVATRVQLVCNFLKWKLQILNEAGTLGVCFARISLN